MCRKNYVNCSFIKLVTLFFATDLNVAKLTILSMVKHMTYSMNVPILGVELKRYTESISNVQFPSNFLGMPPKLLCLQDKIKLFKLLNWNC